MALRSRTFSLALVALCAGALAAPLMSSGDDGMGESMGEGLGGDDEKNMSLKIMSAAEKIWHKGERKDGSESMNRMEAALDKVETKALNKAELHAERVVEKNAIQTHNPHPRQFVKDESKDISKGVQMAEAMIGDDIGQMNKGYHIAGDVVKQQGGAIQPNYGAKMDEAVKQNMHMVNYANSLHKAMETYDPDLPGHSSLLEVSEFAPADIKVDKDVITKVTPHANAVSNVAPTKKAVAKVEGDKSKAAKVAKAPAEQKASAHKVASAKKTANGVVDVSKNIESIMAEVKGNVDLQFAPVEEQLGYNLHQEAAMAEKESERERSRSIHDEDVGRKAHDLRQANALALAAKRAEAQASLMKKAVNFAKKEHAAGTPQLPGTQVLLQMPTDATAGTPEALHPEVQKMAIKKIKERNSFDDMLQKVMRKGEETINTELAPEVPQEMQSRFKDDLLDRTLTPQQESLHVLKETKLMESLHSSPAPAKVVDPTLKEMFHDTLIQMPIKMEAEPLGNTGGRVMADVHQEVNLQDQIERLTQASITKAEADDQHAFGDLASHVDPSHVSAYGATQKMQSQMSAVGKMVEDANIQAQDNVINGVLPNGQAVRPMAHVSMMPLPKH